ncbi:hypothetical protein [Bradyrhizobium sp. BR 1432]|uniref:hypothetical protein n=1 Tax=Bradyrhizobium sp. BR 1432 TaxID=3447966 RepID=UPI003EE81B9D
MPKKPTKPKQPKFESPDFVGQHSFVVMSGRTAVVGLNAEKMDVVAGGALVFYSGGEAVYAIAAGAYTHAFRNA